MGAQHHGRTGWHSAYIINENHTQPPEVINDVLIMNNFVIAVDGRLKNLRHPVEGLDGLLDAGTKAARGSQEDTIDYHEGHPNDHRRKRPSFLVV